MIWRDHHQHAVDKESLFFSMADKKCRENTEQVSGTLHDPERNPKNNQIPTESKEQKKEKEQVAFEDTILYHSLTFLYFLS